MKNISGKLFATSLILILLFGSGINLSAFAESKNVSQEQKRTDKQVKRLKKYFGKKDSAGHDYSVESTAGVGGIGEGDLKADDAVDLRSVKDKLYKQSPETTIKTIENYVKSGK